MSLLTDLFAGQSTIDFRPRWRISARVAMTLIAVSVLLLLVRGLNLSIDFQGGGVWEVPVADDVTVADARAAVPAVDDARIQLVRTTSGNQIRLQSGTAALERSDDIVGQMAELGGVDRDAVAVSEIGPTWGDQITEKAVRALVLFFIVVALYLAWRLEWRMAVGALAAVVHDLLITAGVYALFGFEVSPATVIALLTILGYSLYDTVVVFDKVLENDRSIIGERLGAAELVSQSMNQVLMRSINTTITTVLPVLSMLLVGGVLLGGAGILDFALALFIGLLLGTYSSIFVAAPLLVWLKERQPEVRRSAEVEARRRERAESEKRRTDQADDSGADLNGTDAEEAAAPVITRLDDDPRLLSPGGGAPRPRKKGKKR